MSAPPPAPCPVFFENAAAFRTWLEQNAARAAELLVGFYKVGSGRPSLSWPESVDEALCFGWIDGVRKRIDDQAYQIRFTPRQKDSIWSAVNIAKAEALIAQGRMRPVGLAAYAQRTERRSKTYSYEQEAALKFTAEEARQFKKQRSAWRFFESTPPSYRKTMLHWLASPKQAATRARRFAKLLEACAAGIRLLP